MPRWSHLLTILALLASSLARVTKNPTIAPVTGQEEGVACGVGCECRGQVLACVGTEAKRLTLIPEVTEPRNTFLNLDFHGNNISEIHPGAWHSYSWAQSLNLTHNCLQHIHGDSFDGLLPLKSLDLSYNQIEKIDPRSFEPIPLLEIINLAHNNLHELQDGTFDTWHGLQLLTSLVLAHNPLTVFGDQYLFHLPALKYIDVGATEIVISAIKSLMTIPPRLENLVLPYSIACCLCLAEKKIEVYCKTVKLHCSESCDLNSPLCNLNMVLPLEEDTFLASLEQQRMHTEVTLHIEPERPLQSYTVPKIAEEKKVQNAKVKAPLAPFQINDEVTVTGETSGIFPKDMSQKTRLLKTLGSKDSQVKPMDQTDLSKLGLLGQWRPENILKDTGEPTKWTTSLIGKIGSHGLASKSRPIIRPGKDERGLEYSRKSLPIYTAKWKPNFTPKCPGKSCAKRRKRSRMDYMDGTPMGSIFPANTKSSHTMALGYSTVSGERTTRNLQKLKTKMAGTGDIDMYGTQVSGTNREPSGLHRIPLEHENQRQLDHQLSQANMMNFGVTPEGQRSRQKEHHTAPSESMSTMTITEPSVELSLEASEEPNETLHEHISSVEREGDMYEILLNQLLRDLILDRSVRRLVCHLVRLIDSECTDPNLKHCCADLISRSSLLLRLYNLHEHGPGNGSLKKYLKKTEMIPKKSSLFRRREFVVALGVTGVVMLICILFCLIKIFSRKKLQCRAGSKSLSPCIKKNDKTKEKKRQNVKMGDTTESSEEEIYTKLLPRTQEDKSVSTAYSSVAWEEKLAVKKTKETLNH